MKGEPLMKDVLDAALVVSPCYGSVTMRLGNERWHDGPGWYYTIDEYEDEGSCGAFATREECEAHAKRDGYTVSRVVETAA